MPQENRSLAGFEIIDEAGADKPWLAMVHGISQDHRVFDPYLETLSQRYRLIRMDLPGHGWSADLPGPYGLSAFADVLAATLDHAGIGQCHFWGTHLSAGTALLMAARTPSGFASLVLEGPVFPGRRMEGVSDFLAKVGAAARHQGIGAARDLWWAEGEWFDVMRANPVTCRAAEQRAIIDDFQGAPWLDSGLVDRPIEPIDAALAACDMPVLLINGARDMPAFLDVAKELGTIIPRSERRLIPDGGGFPLWEYPERVAPVVAEFLRRCDRS